jgi:hypothetical protein
MKKFIRTGLLPIALVIPLLGEDCEKSVEIAVPVAADVPFQINSTNAVYSDVETVDFTDEVEKALADADLTGNDIIDIKIESVVYTVMQNASAPNTLVSGLLRVGTINSNNPQSANLLGQLTNVDLSAIAGREQVPALNSAGVTFLNNKLRNAIILKSEAGIFKAFIDGQVTPAPPPDLAFQLTAKVNLTAVVLQKVNLPKGCSNPLEF